MESIHHKLFVMAFIIFLLGCSNGTEKTNTECTDTEVPCLIVSGNNKVEAVRELQDRIKNANFYELDM